MAELDLGGAGVADLALTRPAELAVIEVWDWLADVGDAFRSWDRKLKGAIGRAEDARVAGCWVLRATRRNRQLVASHATLFAARFPSSGTAWLAALTDPAYPMPEQPGLMWVTVRGDRLFAARLRAARP